VACGLDYKTKSLRFQWLEINNSVEDVFHRYIDKEDAFKVVNYYVILSNTSVEKES